ncbi:MAG: putative glycoside hydrolase, partial [Gemmatimonadales bacterium]
MALPPPVVPFDWPAPPVTAPPKIVKAIYLNAWTFGSPRFYDLIRLADTTEINAFVIDVKDDTGFLTYRSTVPTAQLIGANRELRAGDVRHRLAVLHQHNIYPIARIVVAKDPLLARERPEWSIRDVNGGLWHDRLKFAWVDAFNDSVWVYAAQLGAEAVQLGFGELQYDYVRFPDEPRARMETARFISRRNNESPRAAVARHLAFLRDRTHRLGVPFTIDIFGMTASADRDLGIGQVWEDLASTADVVLPMVYPSHYYGGFYNILHPNTEPYQVVHRALQDAERRSAVIPRSARIRPYLQAFTLGRPRYTPVEIRDQIRAAADLGIESWVLWN